jgi:hypothetical protein
LWLANGSASVNALTNSFCNFDSCLKRLDRLGLVISRQSSGNLCRSILPRGLVERTEKGELLLGAEYRAAHLAALQIYSRQAHNVENERQACLKQARRPRQAIVVSSHLRHWRYLKT